MPPGLGELLDWELADGRDGVLRPVVVAAPDAKAAVTDAVARVLAPVG